MSKGRHMGFSLTTEQVRARSKTVTRRLGWLKAKVGDRLVAVEKTMGLRKGEQRVRLAELEITADHYVTCSCWPAHCHAEIVIRAWRWLQTTHHASQ